MSKRAVCEGRTRGQDPHGTDSGQVQRGWRTEAEGVCGMFARSA